MRLLCALGLFLALLHVTSCLLIGAFNIENFGHGKFNKEVTTPKGIIKAIDIITEIVQRYDIILIQELRDKDGTVTERLMELVNKGSHQFRNISSGYLGPSSRKERYLFLYSDETVTVKDQEDSFQYDDTAGVFDRPPFVVKFSSTQTGKEFVLIPIHTQTDKAVKEIDALVDVVKEAKLKWTNNNIMVLGDFNAGIRYVGTGDWKKDIPLFTDKGFHSLIDDGVATTLAEKTIQTHDRIVVSKEMNEEVVNGSAGVFNFKTDSDFDQDQAKKVSDHFPVEVELKPKEEPEAKKRRLNPN
ncbi:deoxyribonuclease-1-like isoform X1 [Trematomus bernacchii]|uniref:deoxyribonuclease-1-like isoform X1 n=1 Tax=Trematomus bernacchii TaxID=40690 RepID=UPI00146C46FD|nr:deoxyribonuclease-1-like isoform X1 [Trematomus bernacchii]